MSEESPKHWRAVRVLTIVAGVVLTVVVLGTLIESVLDYFSLSLDGRLVVQTIFSPQVLSVGLVAIEEAGVPLPISGDVIIAYAASRAGPNPSAWLALGVGFEIAVLTGSSFLFLISRRWGPRLLRSVVGEALNLTPARIEQVEGWFRRWGIWTVIVGRQVPGFRVATTVVAASFGVRYPVFIFGVAVAAAFWITLFTALGLLVGPQVQQLLGAHQTTSLLLLGGALLAAFLFVVGRITWERRRRAVS